MGTRVVLRDAAGNLVDLGSDQADFETVIARARELFGVVSGDDTASQSQVTHDPLSSGYVAPVYSMPSHGAPTGRHTSETPVLNTLTPPVPLLPVDPDATRPIPRI